VLQDESRNVALDLAHDLDREARKSEMASRGKQVEPPDVSIVLESGIAQHVAAGLAQVGHELLVKLGECHGPSPSQGGDALPVLELARELEGCHADILDLLDGHIGVEGGDGVPAALVTDADVDACLADAKTHEGFTLFQNVVAGFGGGRLAESIFDDGRIDPGNRGTGWSSGHQRASLLVRWPYAGMPVAGRLWMVLGERCMDIGVSFRLDHALEGEVEPVRIRYFPGEELGGIQG
jgi:hypothetical protein